MPYHHPAKAAEWSDSNEEKDIAMVATQAYEEIKEEGRREGREELLLRQLARKFGDVPAGVEARIHAASADDLDRWGEALVLATSLEAIFE